MPTSYTDWALVCTMQDIDLMGELLASGGPPGNVVWWDTLRRKERTGCSFIDWNPAFTPKEHAEMLEQSKLREWQKHQDELRRAWEAEESRLNREHHQRLTVASDTIQSAMASATRSAAKSQLVGVVVSVVGILAAVVIALWLGDNNQSDTQITLNVATPNAAVSPP